MSLNIKRNLIFLTGEIKGRVFFSPSYYALYFTMSLSHCIEHHTHGSLHRLSIHQKTTSESCLYRMLRFWAHSLSLIILSASLLYGMLTGS